MNPSSAARSSCTSALCAATHGYNALRNRNTARDWFMLPDNRMLSAPGTYSRPPGRASSRSLLASIDLPPPLGIDNAEIDVSIDKDRFRNRR